ncbi:hypothetical protein GIS00_06480 [Nakamurella sp. YIM 132087]|uniref:Uncharacterized protein n=1 Tax=Nakamurella alba TaxID=2665158 RepID=A0A7K1FJH0_9ACTN|nr:hypothetical protein [Nakamurella alba]MTD13589.1 hypothetical protein [Nakamurella alba]
MITAPASSASVIFATRVAAAAWSCFVTKACGVVGGAGALDAEELGAAKEVLRLVAEGTEEAAEGADDAEDAVGRDELVVGAALVLLATAVVTVTVTSAWSVAPEHPAVISSAVVRPTATATERRRTPERAREDRGNGTGPAWSSCRRPFKPRRSAAVSRCRVR